MAQPGAKHSEYQMQTVFFFFFFFSFNFNFSEMCAFGQQCDSKYAKKTN